MPAALPFLSATFALGIALGSRTAPSTLFLVCCGVLAGIASVVIIGRKKPAGAALLFLFLVLGLLAQQMAVKTVHGSWEPFLGEKTEISGYVQQELSVDGEYQAFLFRAERARVGRGHWVSLKGSVRVTVPGTADLPLDYGQRLLFRGSPALPAGQRNPGGFNYANYLASSDVGAVLSVRARDVTVLSGLGGNFFIAATAKIRERATEMLRLHLPSGEAGLAAGLLLGDRRAVSPRTVEAYQRLGMAHLLAVSGLNVGYVAAFVFFLTGLVFRRRRGLWPALAASFFVLGYVFLTGGQPPVWRAALTMLLVLLAYETGRQRDSLQILAAVALLLLFFRPLWLFSLSFQLSFLATAGILLLPPRIKPYLACLPTWLASSLAVILAAQLAVLPLQVTHFGLLAVLAVPANLLCVPLLGLIMLLGLAGILAGLVAAPLAGPFFWTALPLLAFLERVPPIPAAWSFATLPLPAIHPLFLLLYFLLLALFAAGVRLRPVTAKQLLVALVLLNLLLLGAWPGGRGGQLQITFLDVGQGLAVHVRTPAGKNILYDAGGRVGFDLGERVVLPYLRAAGVRNIELLILSHPHFDHYGGMGAVVENIPVRAFISNGEKDNRSEFQTLLQALEASAVPRFVVEEGYGLRLDGVVLEVLSPPRARFRASADDLNNNSLVIRLTYGDFVLLLTGDAETEAIARLVREHPEALAATVLQVPHHGSGGAISATFLKLCAAQTAVIPVGKNIFGHPRPETLALLAEHGLTVYRTDWHGAVTITSDGSVWQVRAQVPQVNAVGVE